MKAISYLVPVAMLLLSFLYNNNPFIVKDEAHQAFEFINSARSNPLRWNDTLAMVAEAKAMDMAKRNYLNHVTPEGYGINYLINQSGYTLSADWLKDKKQNMFESIGSGQETGIEAIKAMIANEDDRNHLLGTTSWDASLYDIGVGFVKSDGSNYRSYTCIIIAKHN